MAKETKVKKTQSELEQENTALKDKVESMLKTPQPTDPGLEKYMSEMGKIKSMAKDEAGSIKVKEFSDHKNISLWSKIGKRIGPLHQTNALRAFEVFWKLGIQLSTDKPTPEQIAAYKETDEYKKWLAGHLKIRAIKDKSKKSGQIEKYMAEIAKLTGTTVEALNHILQPGEVQKVSDQIK